jgi:tellurite resistance protein TerB
MLGKLFGKKGKAAAQEVKKMANRDLMEGLVGASLLVAAADGEIEPEEVESLEKQLECNPALEGFGPEIGKTINKFTSMLEAGFLIGKTKIMREIKDCASDPEEAEDIFVAAITIAQADGEVEPEEQVILAEIGRTLGLSVRDYGLDG